MYTHGPVPCFNTHVSVDVPHATNNRCERYITPLTPNNTNTTLTGEGGEDPHDNHYLTTSPFLLTFKSYRVSAPPPPPPPLKLSRMKKAAIGAPSPSCLHSTDYVVVVGWLQKRPTRPHTPAKPVPTTWKTCTISFSKTNRAPPRVHHQSAPAANARLWLRPLSPRKTEKKECFFPKNGQKAYRQQDTRRPSPRGNKTRTPDDIF
ncbi:unnamed protein product [Ectocarpus sp. 12 AP-2014]